MNNKFCLEPKIGIDLHTHSDASDGKWSAHQLVRAAVAQQIKILSVTDHETTENLPQLARLARLYDIQLIPGVEIAVEHRSKAYHLLLYGFNPEDKAFQAMLANSRAGLLAKRHTIAERLVDRGYNLPSLVADRSTSPVYELAGALVKANNMLSFKEAWDICRAVSTEIKVAQPVQKALEIGRKAGAVAILAHPGRGGSEISIATDEVIGELAEMGLDGVEAHYSTHSPMETERLLNISRKLDLLVTCGSDSHDANRKPIPYNATLCRTFLERLRPLKTSRVA